MPGAQNSKFAFWWIWSIWAEKPRNPSNSTKIHVIRRIILKTKIFLKQITWYILFPNKNELIRNFIFLTLKLDDPFWSKAWLAGQQAKARARLMIFCRLFCSISLIDMIWWATWFMDFFWGLRYTVLRLFVQLWDYYCTLGYIFISHDIHKVGDY